MLDSPSTLFIFYYNMVDILNILSTEGLTEEYKFLRYCEFFKDYVNSPFQFDNSKLNEKLILDDSVQEFYPEFLIIFEFFKIPKILYNNSRSFIYLKLKRLKVIYRYFQGLQSDDSSFIKFQKFKHGFLVLFKKQLKNYRILDTPFCKSKINSLTLQKSYLKDFYNGCLPYGYIDIDDGSGLINSIPTPSVLELVTDFIVFTEGNYDIDYTGAKEVTIKFGYNEEKID